MNEAIKMLIDKYKADLKQLYKDIKDSEYAEHQCCIEAAIYYYQQIIEDLQKLLNMPT